MLSQRPVWGFALVLSALAYVAACTEQVGIEPVDPPAASDAPGAAGEAPAEAPVEAPTEAAVEPGPLDLTLPQEELSDIALGPDTKEAAAQLPDFFDQAKKKRRTTVSGGLIINEGSDEDFNLERVDGAQLDVEVSLGK